MRLVIFDVDGTLVDSQDHIVEGQRRAFLACGLTPPSRERSLSIVGLSLREAFVVLAGPDAPVDSLADAYRDAWTAMRNEPTYGEPLYSGVAALVASLHADPAVQLGIATGKSWRGVARLLDAQGWRSTFATVQTADDHPSKPHPSMILKALADTGREADEAVMIGDTTFDMTMATAAGVRAIGVGWGYHAPAALRAAGASCIVDTVEALRIALAP